jgi:hypothetical protein
MSFVNEYDFYGEAATKGGYDTSSSTSDSSFGGFNFDEVAGMYGGGLTDSPSPNDDFDNFDGVDADLYEWSDGETLVDNKASGGASSSNEEPVYDWLEDSVYIDDADADADDDDADDDGDDDDSPLIDTLGKSGRPNNLIAGGKQSLDDALAILFSSQGNSF